MPNSTGLQQQKIQYFSQGRAYQGEPFQISNHCLGLVTDQEHELGSIIRMESAAWKKDLTVVKAFPGPTSSSFRIQCTGTQVGENFHKSTPFQRLQACRFPLETSYLSMSSPWNPSYQSHFLIADGSSTGARVLELSGSAKFNPNNVVSISVRNEKISKRCEIGLGKIVRWSDPIQYRSNVFWRGYGIDVIEWKGNGAEYWQTLVEDSERKFVESFPVGSFDQEVC